MNRDDQIVLNSAFREMDVPRAIDILRRVENMEYLDERELVALALLYLYPAAYDPKESMRILRQAHSRFPLASALWGGYIFISDWAGDDFFETELATHSSSAEARYLLSSVLSIKGEEDKAVIRANESLKIRRFPRNLINKAIVDSSLTHTQIQGLYREALKLAKIAGPELGYDSPRDFVKIKYEEFILGTIMGQSEYEHHADKLDDFR